MPFLGEIKRRKVFQVAAVYAVVAWLIIQMVDVVSEPLNLPGWLDTVVIVLLAVGFPVAVILAWAFDITPEGIKRDTGVDAPPEQQPAETSAMVPQHKSIVVLPFVNMSADSENEYFSDGLTEEIINALTQLQDLSVAARTSSFVFKGKNTDIAEVGQKLKVNTVLEGSVRKVENRLRITAQLINVADGYHLWSEKFDRELGDVFAIQDEISLAIVDKLKVRLTSGEKAQLVGKQTVNLAAHEDYLQGRYFWNQRGPGLKKAVDLFQLALAKDNNYATAYAGLADTYSLLGFYGYLPPMDVMPRAREAALHALEIDENLAEAHCSLGYVHTIFDWDWEKARKEFQRALDLNPSYVPARYWYSVLLWFMGHIEEAISEARCGLETDSLSVYGHVQLASVLFSAQKHEQAAEQLLQALDLEPDFYSARAFLGIAYYFQSRVDDAIYEIQKAIDMSDRNQWPVAYLGTVYAAIGDRTRADEILAELEDRSQKEYIHANWIAQIYALLDEKDQAFDWLEKAFNERAPIMGSNALKTYPGWFYNSLRDDSRFQDLLRRQGLIDRE
jgi:TolB-like protein/Tfp pilus assembly protein PilF